MGRGGGGREEGAGQHVPFNAGTGPRLPNLMPTAQSSVSGLWFACYIETNVKYTATRPAQVTETHGKVTQIRWEGAGRGWQGGGVPISLKIRLDGPTAGTHTHTFTPPPFRHLRPLCTH